MSAKLTKVPDPPKRVQAHQNTDRTFKALADEIDVIGGIIGITALVLFNFAWNQAGVVGWKSPYVCVALIVGLLLVPVFFWYELRIAKSPLVPFDILKVEIGFVLACVSCGWGCFGIWVRSSCALCLLHVLRHRSWTKPY